MVKALTCLARHSTVAPCLTPNESPFLSAAFAVPYQATLRTVTHDGSPAPLLPPRTTRKHPGYIRNEMGGLFTS